jgi:hypothetical protein
LLRASWNCTSRRETIQSGAALAEAAPLATTTSASE